MANRSERLRGCSKSADEILDLVDNTPVELFSNESSDEDEKENPPSRSSLPSQREERTRVSVTRMSRSASQISESVKKPEKPSSSISPPIKLLGEIKTFLMSSFSSLQAGSATPASSSNSSSSSTSSSSSGALPSLASTPSPPASPRGDSSSSSSVENSPNQVGQIPESDDEAQDGPSSVCYLWTLPHAIVMRFHQYLSMHEISQCIPVSRDWFRLCKGEIFWKQLFKEWWPLAQDLEGHEYASLPNPTPTHPDRWKQICITIYHRRKSLLCGKSISSTGLKRCDKDEVAKIVAALGGTYAADFSRQVNYLIAATYRSEKYRLAIRINTPVVTFQWLLDTAAKVYCQAPNIYRPIFEPPIICGTGFSVKDREALKEEVLELGGRYSNALTRTCTHLLARPTNDGRKLAAAQRWQVTIHRLSETDPLKPVVKNCFPLLASTPDK